MPLMINFFVPSNFQFSDKTLFFKLMSSNETFSYFNDGRIREENSIAIFVRVSM